MIGIDPNERFKIGNEYFWSRVDQCEEDFADMLDDDVIHVHAQDDDGIQGDPVITPGKEGVIQWYHDKLFSVAAQIEVQKYSVSLFRDMVKLECRTKITYHTGEICHFKDWTTLTISDENLITRITSIVEKVVLHEADIVV